VLLSGPMQRMASANPGNNSLVNLLQNPDLSQLGYRAAVPLTNSAR